MRTIKRIFRFLLSIKVKAKALINVFYNKTLYYSASYYPENRKKNMLRAFWYHIKFAIKNGTNDEFYFLYGLDGENSAKENEYIAYSNFMEYRNKNNFELKDKNYNYVAILRDKFIFGQLLKSIGFNTPKNIAILQKKGEGVIIRMLEDRRDASIQELLSLNLDVFCKLMTGECGVGVFNLQINNGSIFINGENKSKDEFIKLIGDSTYLIQERVEQHCILSSIHKHSINTIRMTTIYNKTNNEVIHFSSTLRIGCNESNVDNWAKGGLIVNIKDDGTLDKYGFYKPGYGTKTNYHPDSLIEFDNYKIPNYKECINKAKELHSFFYGIHSIGWDIAIDKQGGPIFIEGNDNWEITLPQATIGGKKKVIKELF